MSEAHCAPDVQGVPIGDLGVHAPASHVWLAMHWVEVVHAVGQVARPEQTNGAQEGTPGVLTAVTHVPARQVSHAPAHAVLQHLESAQ